MKPIPRLAKSDSALAARPGFAVVVILLLAAGAMVPLLHQTTAAPPAAAEPAIPSVAGVPSIFAAPAAGEPAMATPVFPPASKPVPRDTRSMLIESELSVLTRHFEQTISKCLDQELDLALLNISYDVEPQRSQKAQYGAQRLKLLDEWRTRLQQQISTLTDELNERQRRQAEAGQPSRSTTPVQKQKPATSPSERPARPEF
jgi:hypothetical protein